MKQKQTFKTIFLFAAISLLVLPFLVTFNSVLTRIVENLSLYTWIQDQVAPIQAKLVAILVKPFVRYVFVDQEKIIVNDHLLRIAWNCLGWQSLLLFGASLFIGLKGNSYTIASKLQIVFLGLVGIFWVNILRMSFTVWLATISMPVFRIVFHDYLAAITTIIWLFFFWWFAYSFVLEERKLW